MNLKGFLQIWSLLIISIFILILRALQVVRQGPPTHFVTIWSRGRRNIFSRASRSAFRSARMSYENEGT